MRHFAEVAESKPSLRIQKDLRIKTKSVEASEDWYSKMRRQQNPETRIVSFVHFDGGHYSFTLTSEEATILGFSDELYTKYSNLVDSLNTALKIKVE